MKTILISTLILLGMEVIAQKMYPIDTTNWEIQASNYMFETLEGKDAIYLQGGSAWLRDVEFKNGTIEVDLYLTERTAFPGVYFRRTDPRNYEIFYIRAHLGGKPDANQAIPMINGLTAWQLYFGPQYSVPYDYKYKAWTHVKIVVKDKQAQLFLDYSEKPNLSWDLVHEPASGQIGFGGSAAPVHYANFTVDTSEPELVDFNVAESQSIDGVIEEWELSDKFPEDLLDDPMGIADLIEDRKWIGGVMIDEGRATNISRKVVRYDDEPGNTVLAKIEFNAEEDQIKLFEFGYSDRVVAILNGQPIYKGNNRWRSRDYRYLGTIGLFDSIYLNLKKGENTLIFAVSEDFGGWLVTGRFSNPEGIKILKP